MVLRGMGGYQLGGHGHGHGHGHDIREWYEMKDE